MFKGDGVKQKVFDGLFTCSSLDAIMKEREADDSKGPLEFGIDLNAAKYVDGVRETPNGEVSHNIDHGALGKVKGVKIQEWVKATKVIEFKQETEFLLLFVKALSFCMKSGRGCQDSLETL